MSKVYAPHITSPKGGEIFNLGKVSITWDKSDPHTEDPYLGDSISTDSSSISYEIEYTENYSDTNTVWHSVKRRIPGSESSFEWVVGKMIKSSSVRVRIRAKDSLRGGELSDWSMGSGDFSINVFKLVSPAIVSPIGGRVYTDFILIILDETLTRSTFNQKVRYTLEYASDKASVSWTVIAKDVPVGQNVIRWDLDGITPADDYVLRLTAKNTASSCLENQEPTPDQIRKRFIYNLKIQQPGMFLIDTKPPKAILEIEGSSGITNELVHTLNIFAEDDTSSVEKIQIRECDTTNQVGLGNIVDIEAEDPTGGCASIEELIVDGVDFGKLIGKPLGYSTKTQWTFADESGQRRLEALLTDSGGNTSVQNLERSFIPVFRHGAKINDMVITTDARNETIIEEIAENEFSLSQVKAKFEVAYLATSDGEYWILEPFPRLVLKSVFDRNITVLASYSDDVYLFTYVNNSQISDTGSVFKDLGFALGVPLLFDFPNPLSIPNTTAVFSDVLYVGLENGELWSWNGSVFALVKTFANSVSTLAGDNEYLYIGLFNSSLLTLYNGTDFFTSDVEV